MNNNENELVKKSLEYENSASSSTHTLNVLADEIKDKAPTIYEIPTSYNVDRAKVLMANPEKYYVYWEISSDTLSKHGIDLNSEKLSFQIKNSDEAILFEFESSFALGEYYVKKVFENMKIHVSVGVYRSNKFVDILASNNMHTFSTQINLPDENSEVWLERSLSWSEVLKASESGLTMGSSSDKFLKEMKRIELFEKSGISGLVNVSGLVNDALGSSDFVTSFQGSSNLLNKDNK